MENENGQLSLFSVKHLTMKRNITLLLLLLILNFACSEREQNSSKYKTILLQESENIEPISSFMSGVRYIELKYPDSVAPGKIESIKLLDNNIIIKQRYAGKATLIRFSADGDFLNKIGEISDSKEIQEPRDVTTYNNDFAVWGESGVHVFTKEDKYQRKIININQPGESFFYSGNKFFFFHESSSPGYLSEYSISGKLNKIFHPVKEEFENTEYSAVTEVTQDKYHLFSPLNDTVFVYSNEKLAPEYVIEGETYPTYIQVLRAKDFNNETDKTKYINNNQYWMITNYLENRNFIFIVYRLGSSHFYLIVRKPDWQTDHIQKFINDIDGGIWDDPICISGNNEIYIPLTSNQISGHKILNKKHHGFEEQIEIAQQNDNPVLMVCKLK